MNTFKQWLPLDVAAQKFGYAHKESLARRLRQLRRRGHVADIGRPPAKYQNGDEDKQKEIVMLWPNPKMALLRQDAPARLLTARRGKRSRRQPEK